MKRGAIQETGSHLMRYGGIGMGHGDRKIATQAGGTSIRRPVGVRRVICHGAESRGR